jgi:hypothetical protein
VSGSERGAISPSVRRMPHSPRRLDEQSQADHEDPPAPLEN